MKDYTIYLNGGNSIGGTADENELIKLKESFRKNNRNAKYSRKDESYEFEDTDGVVCVNLFDIQGIAIMKCSEHKDIGFIPYKVIGDKEICLTSQTDVDKCMKKFANKLMNGLNSVKR